MSLVTTPIQIRFSDVDMGHHVHNAAYLQYFELGRMALLREVAGRDHDWVRTGLILARNEVDHRLPIHLADEVSVEAWCLKLGTKSFDLAYRIFSGKDGGRRIHAEGRSVMVAFDYGRQAPITLPEAWRTALARFMDNGDT